MTWAIGTPVNIEHRAKIDSGRPLFAWLDFKLLPSDNPDGLMVAESWIDNSDSRWIDAIYDGAIAFVTQRRIANRPVGFTTIDMKRVIFHSIGTDSHAVAYNMRLALEVAFEEHEVQR